MGLKSDLQAVVNKLEGIEESPSENVKEAINELEDIINDLEDEKEGE